MKTTPKMTTLVRMFSPAGPCLTLGRYVRETAKFYVYNEWCGGDLFDAEEKRIAKSGRAHIDVCRSCCDHSRTMYPHGYMD